MMQDTVVQLKRSRTASFSAPVPTKTLLDRLRQQSLTLPSAHMELLALANGITAYHGYYRLFGVDSAEGGDLLAWNDPSTWKFAWAEDLTDYLCFAETGWGDQYAYSIQELGIGGTSRVYQLDAIEMKAELICADFDDFIAQEFLPCAENPYDPMTAIAYKRFGALEWESHVMHTVPLLLGGQANADNLTKTGARVGMIINGDIASQCSGDAKARRIRALEPYLDTEGRTRIRLVWY